MSNEWNEEFPKKLAALGYTAEELERDNPYNAWLYDKEELKRELSPLFGMKINNPMEVIKMSTLELKQSKNPLVIYHANCADGFSAAWCFHNAQDEQEQTYDFHPGVYGEEPPDCAGRVVYLVDFSYKRKVVEEILEVCDFLYLIDHHKTAIEDLNPLIGHPKFIAYVDIERSGAMLAWDFLHNAKHRHDRMIAYTHVKGESTYKEPPLLLDHVQDRDLWKFKLDGTRPISAGMFSHEYTFANWDAMMAPGDKVRQITERHSLWQAGDAIERKHFKDIKELVKVMARAMLIGGSQYGIMMSVANLPYTMASDACHLMAIEPSLGSLGVAACYYDTAEHRIFSLRSEENSGIDVSKIAAYYGGGGHFHAAGFKVLRKDYLAQV